MKVHKAAKLGKKIVKQAACKVNKEVKHIIHTRIASKKEARQFIGALISEAREESGRIASFAKKEWGREMKKAKPVMKKVVHRLTR